MTRFSSLHFITNGSTKNNKKNLIKIKMRFFLFIYRTYKINLNMGKSIEEILKQIESERNQRINEEQSKLDEINQQRDLARKEWNKRMKMYENLSSNSSNSAGAGAGGGGSISTPLVDYTITGITYGLRHDAFWHIVDLEWDTHPLSVLPDTSNTTISAVYAGTDGSASNPTIAQISIFLSGNPNRTGANIEFSKTSNSLNGDDTIIISVLTTTGQYATGSIGPLDFTS
jgi:hypothetical protein